MKLNNRILRNLRSQRSRKIKKVIFIATTMLCFMSLSMLGASALPIRPITLDFTSSAQSALTTVVTLIGGGLGVWGVVNLLEGYGNDNPGAKSQGIKQAVAGVGLVIVGQTLIPAIFST